MTCLINHTTRCRNKIAAWCWRKRFWLSKCKKVKSEQHFAITSAKRVAIFQGSLKLVREKAWAQLSLKRIINFWHLTDQNFYVMGGTINKNYALTLWGPCSSFLTYCENLLVRISIFCKKCFGYKIRDIFHFKSPLFV